MIKDLKLDLPSNLPSKTNDLFSFNFENLIKTIDYLHKYNLALFSQLQNFNKRMILVEEILPEFYKLKNKVENIENKTKEHETLINENKNKIKEFDENIKDINKKMDKNESNINKNKELINENKENIENIFKNNNININNQKNLNINEEQIKKFLNENLVIGNNKEIESIKNNINKINEVLKEIKNNNKDKKVNLEEKDISNFLNSLNNEESNILPENNKENENIFKMIIAQIDKGKKNFENFMKDYNLNQEKIKEDIKWLNKQVDENKINYESISKSYNEESDNKKKYVTYNDIKDIFKNVDTLLNKIKEYSKKTELDNVKSEIKKINEKLKDLSDKEKEFSTKKEEENINFNKNISELISDIIKSEGKNLDISQNKHYIELMKINQQNAKDLIKNNQDFSDLKNIIFSSQTQAELNKLKDDMIKFKNDYNNHKNKLLDLIELVGDFNKKKEEKEEEEEEEISDNKLKHRKSLEIKLQQTEETIKGKIENLTDCLQIMNSKLMILEKKNNSFTKDIRNEMKSKIKSDIYQVVEQFKLKLNSFTVKFENELKNKIDQIGLNMFESKLNSKLNMDLKDKLNKNDLKKNNLSINKKIDKLENKISKTLVDTIIDLQMDDAPLLAKKNKKNLELCASCNRPLIEKYNHTLDHFNVNTSPIFKKSHKNKLNTVVSLKKLPDISSNNQK